jgi:hypothetical protein
MLKTISIWYIPINILGSIVAFGWYESSRDIYSLLHQLIIKHEKISSNAHSPPLLLHDLSELYL